jgi:hypothetical protein
VLNFANEISDAMTFSDYRYLLQLTRCAPDRSITSPAFFIADQPEKINREKDNF